MIFQLLLRTQLLFIFVGLMKGPKNYVINIKITLLHYILKVDNNLFRKFVWSGYKIPMPWNDIVPKDVIFMLHGKIFCQ